MSEVTRVLSIDGGGIRGVIPAVILAKLEHQTRQPIHRLFDVISGTSTGGIIACGLTKPKPMSAQDLVNLYAQQGPAIFGKTFRSVTSFVSGSKYDAAVLNSVLNNALGDARLSQCQTDVLIPAYDIEQRDAHFFKSWRAQGTFNPPDETAEDADFYLRDIARATAAAPTYFEPALIHSMSGDPYALIDGSVVANNPGMCALASVRKLYPDTKRVVLLSIGTGQPTRPIPYSTAREWGALSWARPVIECMTDGMADTVDYQLREAYTDAEVTYVRINTRMGEGPSPPSDDIDDASAVNIGRLIGRAELMARMAAADIARITPLLV